jgi:hypothetical protein
LTDQRCNAEAGLVLGKVNVTVDAPNGSTAAAVALMSNEKFSDVSNSNLIARGSFPNSGYDTIMDPFIALIGDNG